MGFLLLVLETLQELLNVKGQTYKVITTENLIPILATSSKYSLASKSLHLSSQISQELDQNMTKCTIFCRHDLL